ncbi:hypothetical protein CALCODRAFT_117333 [Calocera cornea HHB12733]|uniref:Family A G protein-coupled receptor-like protein n=1 Tax=Calocera cornea HHB12733 TaxID=1353952 RepID=A0A165ICF4_9BASI|nr:hypothetical protein CALCODRAFT_117333 [Calocera cornea HHB12733]
MTLPVDTAVLAGLFASSILYGMFVVLLVACLYVLLYQQKTKQPNYLLIVASYTMLIVNTIILGLSFSRVLDAFIQVRDAPGGPSGYLGILSQWKEVARTSFCSFYIFVADLTLIYRCWIVWSRSFLIIALPIAIHVAYTVMSCLLNINMAHLPQDANVFDPEVRTWIIAALSISLGQNVIVTGLIVFKILSVNYRATGKRLGSLKSTVVTIVESGAIYSITVFVYLMTYACSSNSQYTMIDILNPIIGITYSLLVVRVAMRQSASSPEKALEMSDHHGQRAPPPVAIEVQSTGVAELSDSVSDFEATK